MNSSSVYCSGEKGNCKVQFVYLRLMQFCGRYALVTGLIVV